MNFIWSNINGEIKEKTRVLMDHKKEVREAWQEGSLVYTLSFG